VSRISTGLHSVYDDDIEMYWSEYVAVFDQRRKKGKKYPTRSLDLSICGRKNNSSLSKAKGRRRPIQTTMDKIIPWLEREGNRGKRIVSFASSSSSSSINNDDEISDS
jgi:hypothetical protein